MKHESAARAALKALIKEFGGPRRLGEYLGVTRQAVESWSMLPLTHISRVYERNGQSLKDLRPDVYQLANLHKDSLRT